MMWRTAPAIFIAFWFFAAGPIQPAHADNLARATAALAHRDYARAISQLSPAARRGNARAEALLGFMYENGFGVPQSFAAAADWYARAAAQGDPFGQNMLGLLYDKGHGVPQDDVLAYKWINLAAAHAGGRERDYYQRLRDAVASKMSSGQIVEGQRLALGWAAQRDGHGF
jgi:TPR repeat protein